MEKKLSLLVELRARFDEENNIGWSRLPGGCWLSGGSTDWMAIKSALQAVSDHPQNGGQVEYITQIGTGNYNEKDIQIVHRPFSYDS